MALNVKTIKVGIERTNCYIVSLNSGETFIVDPGAEPEKILVELSNIKNLDLKYILLTHGHFDHVGAVDRIKELYTEVPVKIHENDIILYRDSLEQGAFVGRLLKSQKSEVEAVGAGEFLPFGDSEIEVLDTPGHTPGGVCYLVTGYSSNEMRSSHSRSNDILFSGDTLFYHTIGRTDLPLSSEKELKLSLDRLMHLPPETIVYPGHGRDTTISEELKDNSHL